MASEAPDLDLLEPEPPEADIADDERLGLVRLDEAVKRVINRTTRQMQKGEP